MRLADVVTSLRIVSAPIVIWLIVSDHAIAAYYLFGAAAISDLLDGYLARRSGKLTSYGATFDGIADFILVYGTIIVLAIEGHGWWLFAAGMTSVAFLIPVLALISRKKGSLTIPHLDTNILAAFVYPTVMAFIIDWRYAEILLLVGFLVTLYSGSKYIAFLRRIYR
jgi:cardiolipin synthase